MSYIKVGKDYINSATGEILSEAKAKDLAQSSDKPWGRNLKNVKTHRKRITLRSLKARYILARENYKAHKRQKEERRESKELERDTLRSRRTRHLLAKAAHARARADLSEQLLRKKHAKSALRRSSWWWKAGSGFMKDAGNELEGFLSGRSSRRSYRRY